MRTPKKTRLMLEIERRHGEPIESLLRRLYIDEGKTLAEVGEVLGLTESGVFRWMERFGIPRRSPEWVLPSA